MSVSANFAFRRVAPPKFGHGQWLQSVEIGVLQEFGGRTFARTGRWVAVGSLFEDLFDVLVFAQGVAQAKLTENPLLDGDGTLFAFFF